MNWRKSISKELERAIADLRNDITRSGPGLVKVFRDQLTLVLDALEPVKVEEVKVPADDKIRVGDTVEILARIDFFGETITTGSRGTVTEVDVRKNNFYPYEVKFNTYTVVNFNRKELRKVA